MLYAFSIKRNQLFIISAVRGSFIDSVEDVFLPLTSLVRLIGELRCFITVTTELPWGLMQAALKGKEGEVKEQVVKSLKTHSAARNDLRASLIDAWPGYHRVS